ncbi:nuclear transport factor 2 family protein [Holzapfeliella sp. He02]|uniref:Nuclear transport factor 2 family protein n=1 Tax=Holzapfeliella saturejae TaxID=3082953 RepID=A0ABU8SGP3_9LACO
MMNIHEQAKQLYRDLYQGMVNQNINLLNARLADNFVLEHMTGIKQAKQDWLQAIETGQMRYYRAQEDQVSIKVTDDSLILIGRSIVDAKIYGFRADWHLQMTLTFSQNKEGHLVINSAVAKSY